jgi:2-polyprenyl-3-methyl-5-hydroxy-6-metoxy-1,4-benzoquinol methylase
MPSSTNASIDRFLSGASLYGDDFSAEEISEWYDDEAEGYADLGARETESYEYHYHALNAHHGFGRIDIGSVKSVLGFGSAYGDELMPVANSAVKITIVDPSGAFAKNAIAGVPVSYVKPAPSGVLPLEGSQFDLICCFGVLHHIPNVSFVVGELARVLKPGGTMMIREPIVSMGDWRQPRAGLTKRERGIPARLLGNMAKKAGLKIDYSGLCDFALTPRIFAPFRRDVYNSRWIVRADAIFARLFGWNQSYHAESMFAKVRPTSVFLVLKKPR